MSTSYMANSTRRSSLDTAESHLPENVSILYSDSGDGNEVDTEAGKEAVELRRLHVQSRAMEARGDCDIEVYQRRKRIADMLFDSNPDPEERLPLHRQDHHTLPPEHEPEFRQDNGALRRILNKSNAAVVAQGEENIEISPARTVPGHRPPQLGHEALDVRWIELNVDWGVATTTSNDEISSLGGTFVDVPPGMSNIAGAHAAWDKHKQSPPSDRTMETSAADSSHICTKVPIPSVPQWWSDAPPFLKIAVLMSLCVFMVAFILTLSVYTITRLNNLEQSEPAMAPTSTSSEVEQESWTWTRESNVDSAQPTLAPVPSPTPMPVASNNLTVISKSAEQYEARTSVATPSPSPDLNG